MRLFVAITLPDPVRFELQLMCHGLPGVRWVAPENLHLSLRFIGEVDNGVMQDIDAGLAGIRAPGFRLRLAGVGHFGNAKIRTLWAGVEPEPALLHLHDKIESAVVRAGRPPEGQKFTPHVTLARPNDPPLRRVQEFLASNSLFKSQPFEVTHFTLYSSFLGRSGPTYCAEHSYPLSRG